MDDVEVIGSELTGTTTVVAFPSLKILKFENMCAWKAWSTNTMVLDVVFPCLQELHIKDCPNLIDISLKALPSVRVLQIYTCSVNALRSIVQAASLVNELGIASIVGLTDEAWRGVIMYLKEVENLSIWHCDEIRYLWELEDMNKVLDVRRCKNLVSLGEKEEDNFESTLLLSLTYLEIYYCESMKHCYCPNSIEYFGVEGCTSLTHVSFPRAIGGGMEKLKTLVISDCKKLTEEINNVSMPMLDFLYISDQWTGWKSITQFSNLNHLTVLYIANCPSIETFQLSNLTSLTYLRITNCTSFCLSFDGGFWPPNLVFLDIGGLKTPISEWGPPNFPSSLVDLTLSRDLDVSDFRQLSHLFPSSLTSLKIEIFLKLESLSTGLQHLSSLQHLKIEKCLMMKHLPVSLLPSLSSLKIALCPYLTLRCNGRGSHYWSRISHIPCIQIDHSKDMEELMENFRNMSKRQEWVDPHSYKCDLTQSTDTKLAGLSSNVFVSSAKPPRKNSANIFSNRKMNGKAVSFIGRSGSREAISQLSNSTHLTRLDISDCPHILSLFDLHLSNLTFLSLCGLWPPKLCSLEIGKLKKAISEWGDLSYGMNPIKITMTESANNNQSIDTSLLWELLLTACEVKKVLDLIMFLVMQVHWSLKRFGH
ncbi:hypothetical protein M8C21_015910 [Ambrosia artemisiifolia]|uniref:Uncharacterized protein n=1 Tax=Ambrosia artemisiifolia TaxID=4212 RepID=A0AAD5D9C6_AMBAR|nr:hypothetical protein M8C21_015910 [Ambrosia artemisiifolia]